MTRFVVRAAVVLALPLSGAACQEPELPEVVWRGEHYEFATDRDLEEVCAGTLAFSDEVAGHIIDRLAIHDQRDPLRLHWIPDDDEYFAWCPNPSAGCITPGGEAISRWPLHRHELVHLVRGRSYPPLTEGIAEYFGDDLDREPYNDVEDVFRMSRLPGVEHYSRLAHFMSYVVSEVGEDALLEFDHESDWEDTFAATDQLAERHWGVSFESLMQGYAEYPDCESFEFRPNEIECDIEVRELSAEEDGVFEETFSLSCAEPSALGPREGKIWRYVTVDVPRSGIYRVWAFNTVENGGDDEIRITRCGGNCADDSGIAGVRPYLSYEIFCWTPGRYLFRFAVDHRSHGQFLLRIESGSSKVCE